MKKMKVYSTKIKTKIQNMIFQITLQRFLKELVNIMNPDTFKEALNSKENSKWIEATDSEMTSLIEYQTWDFINLPEAAKHYYVGGFIG